MHALQPARKLYSVDPFKKMSLSYGIVGLPNVGKSRLFNALTQRNVPSKNFPFCTIDPNLGKVAIQDPRLDLLAKWVKTEKKIPSFLNFVDIAGLVKNASDGEGLGNKFLSHIASVDALIHLLRCFEDKEITHITGEIDPVFDKNIVEEELRQKDLTLIVNFLKRKKKFGDISTKNQNAWAIKYQKILEGGNMLHEQIEIKNKEEKNFIKQLALLTNKPMMYIANIDEKTLLGRKNIHWERLKIFFEEKNKPVIPICLPAEEIWTVASLNERKILEKKWNKKKSGLTTLAQYSYNYLQLITFFTQGPKEIRGWQIQKGISAPQAASVIHTDFQKKFIKAEVISFNNFATYKSEEACKKAGKITIQGKNYQVQDGDIIHFKCRR